jgi:lactoylglutathione lyase
MAGIEIERFLVKEGRTMKKVNYTIVFVSDMNRSIRFYRDVLGLPLKFESPKWTEFATLGSTLALHGDAKPAQHAAQDYMPAGSCHPGFEVEDIEPLHQKLVAKGVRCIRPPKMEDFGAKLAVYADPDGLPISISEVARKEKR